MALNYSGVGFGFLAKDQNLGKTLTGFTSGFSKLQEKFKVVAAGAKTAGQKIGHGIGAMGKKGKAAFGGMAGMIDSMTSKALSPRLDNAFSSMYAQAAKSWGEIVAGMNMTDKESRKLQNTITSVTYSLNSDFQGAANGVAAFYQQGLKLKDFIGGKSTRQAISRLVKITATLGIEGQQLALVYANLTKSYGFNAKSAKGMVDVYFAMAKSANIGKEAMQALPNIMETLDQNLATFAKAGPKETKQLVFSLLKAAGAYKAMGASGAQSMQLSQSLFTTITKEWKGVAKAMTGLGQGDPLGELGKQLMETKGDVGSVLDLLRADPAKFVKGLQTLYQKAEKAGQPLSAGLFRLQQRITDSLGPNMSFMVQDASGRSIKAMQAMDKVAENSTKTQDAVAKAANKAYKTGLTGQDYYQRMLDSQKAALDRLTNKDVNKWVKDQKSGFKALRGHLKEIGDKGGPLAEIVKRFMMVQRVGISGFFTGMKGVGPLVQNFVTQSGPMLAALAHMGMAFSLIGKLLLPGGILLLGMALFHKGMREKIVDGAKKAFDYLKKKWPEWVPKIKQGLVNAWQAAVNGINWLMEVTTPIMNKMADAINRINWSGIADRIISFVSKVLHAVKNAIFGGEALTPDMTTVEGRFQAAGMKLISALARGARIMLSKFASAIWNYFTDWSVPLEEKGKMLGTVLLIGMFFGPTRSLIFGGIKLIGMILMKFIPMIASIGGLYAIAFVAAFAAGFAIGYYIAKYWDDIKAGVADAFNYVKDTIFSAVDTSVEFIKGVGDSIWEGITWPFKKAGNFISETWGDIKSTVASAWDRITGKTEESTSEIEGTVGSSFRGIAANIAMAAQNGSNSMATMAENSIVATNRIGEAGAGTATGIARNMGKAGELSSSAMSDASKSAQKSFQDTQKAAVVSGKKTIEMYEGAAKALGMSPEVIKMFQKAAEKMTFKRATLVTGTLSDIKKEKIASLWGPMMAKSRKALSQFGISRDWIPEFEERMKTTVEMLVGKGADPAKAMRQAQQDMMQHIARSIARGIATVYADKMTGGRRGYTWKKKYAFGWKNVMYHMQKQTFAGEEIFGRGMATEKLLEKIGLADLYAKEKKGKGVKSLKAFKAKTKVKTKGISTDESKEVIDAKKRTLIDKQLSDDSKKAMQDISVQVNQLTAAIKALQVDVVVTGDVGAFIKATITRLNQGNKRGNSSRGSNSLPAGGRVPA